MVGPREMLAVDRITGIRPWAGAPIAEEATGQWFNCHVQVPAEPVPRARVTTGDVDGVSDAIWEIELDETIQGAAQVKLRSMQGTRVLGQATTKVNQRAALQRLD